jgi:hypothetical protein
MDYKKFSLDKMANKLSKTLEAKEHFDKREEEKSYIKKIQILKEILTNEYKFASQNRLLHKNYAIKLEVIEKHIGYIRKMQNKKILDSSDKQIVDTLLSKYSA